MSLSTLAILLGAGFAVPQVFGLMRPVRFKEIARAFPRNTEAGYVLVALATVWFLYNLKLESVADFAHLKKYMLVGFGALGVATCLFVKDYLAVRGLAVVLLLLAKYTLDTARWADTELRLVLVVWAYVWICAGIWFTVSPWRLRDIIGWMTEDENRIRNTCIARLAFAVLVVALGLFVF